MFFYIKSYTLTPRCLPALGVNLLTKNKRLLLDDYKYIGEHTHNGITKELLVVNLLLISIMSKTSFSQSVETINTDNLVIISNNETTTTTLKIAEFFGKRHDDVLKKIKSLDCSPEFTHRNFAVSEYLDSTGKSNLMYNITKDGFVFLTMGFTGSKASKFKEAYINCFNKMEQTLKNNQIQIAPEPKNELDLLKQMNQYFNTAIIQLEITKQELERKEITIKVQSKIITSQNDTNTSLITLKAGQFKTAQTAVKCDIGKEINYYVLKIYLDQAGGVYPEAHRLAKRDFNWETGDNYLGAKLTSLETKKVYLKWLRSKINNVNNNQLELN